MRTAVLVLALAAASTAWAGSSRGTDPEGDENSWPVVDELDCRAPSIDIVELRVDSADGVLTVRLTVLDLEDEGIHCEHAFGRSSANIAGTRYQVALHQPYVCDVVCQAAGPSIRFTAAHPLLEPRSGCASFSTHEGNSSGCAGKFAVEGSTLVWTLPLQGTVGRGEEARPYDLSGLSFQVWSYSMGQHLFVTSLMFDYAEAPDVTL